MDSELLLYRLCPLFLLHFLLLLLLFFLLLPPFNNENTESISLRC